jgi:hypothetical protein
MVGAHHRLQSLHQRFGKLFIEAEGAATGAIAAVEQGSIAVSVYDGYVFRAQTVDGTGDELRNRLLGLLGKMSAAGFENDGSFRVVLLLSKQ